MNKRKGISLIVLVITILVMIILAGVVVVSLQKNNPIEKAKEATFKQSLAQIGEELEMFCVNEKAQNSEFNKETLHASKNNLAFNTKTESSGKNIYDIIPSLKDSKYKNQIEVIQGMLFYRTPDKKEIPWLRELGIHYTGIVTGTVEIEGATLVGVSPDYVNTGTLVIPNTVKKINPGAFSGCKDLNAVVLPEGITEIPNDCFKNCTSLTSVQLPETVKVIGEYAFHGCSTLVKINMPRDLEDVKTMSFYSCNSLRELSFNKVKYIRNGAFRFCTNLAKVNFGTSLEKIEYIAFGNTAIESVKFPNTLKTVEGSIFYDTDALKTVQIGDDIPGQNLNVYIEKAVFRNCDGITSITIAENPKYIYKENVRYSKDGRELQEVPANKGNFSIPTTVTKILDGAFINNSNITEITVPEGVTYIGENAFSSTKELTTLSLPSTVTNIGIAIIGTTKKLVNCTIAPGNPNYYMDNGAIVHKYINQQGIEEREIIGCVGGKKGPYNISNGITIIGDFAFQECTGITSITIPSTVKEIKRYGLYLLNSIENLTIPGNVKKLGHAAIHYCTALKTVTLEEGVEEIASEIFKYCINLQTVNLPSTLKTVGTGIFKSTNKLTTVTTPDVPTNKFAAKGNMLFTKDLTELVSVGCDSTKTIIEVPSHVRVIRDHAISDNIFVKEVRIKPGVTTIGNNILLDNKNLRRVTIPSTVTFINTHAFQRTDSLSEIVIDKPEGSITGAPWTATQGMKAIIWQ